MKAYAERAAAPPSREHGGEPREEPATTRPGTEYLKRRKASLRDRDDAWREAATRAERIHDVLAAVAVASRRHRPQDPQLSGRDEWMLLNDAYLVDDDRVEEFAATLDALRGPGVEIELTGPWAPYSFTTLEPDDSGPDAGSGGSGPEARGGA